MKTTQIPKHLYNEKQNSSSLWLMGIKDYYLEFVTMV